MKQLSQQYMSVLKQWPSTVIASLLTLITGLALNHTDSQYDNLVNLLGHLVGVVLLGFLTDEYVRRTTDNTKKAGAYLAYWLSQVVIYLYYNLTVTNMGWSSTQVIIRGIQYSLILVYMVLIARRVGVQSDPRDGGFTLGVYILIDETLMIIGKYIITLSGVFLTMFAVEYMVYQFSSVYYLDAALIITWLYSQYLLKEVGQFKVTRRTYLQFLVEWVAIPLLTVYTLVLFYGMVTGQRDDFFTGQVFWVIYLTVVSIVQWIASRMTIKQVYALKYLKVMPYILTILVTLKTYNLVQEWMVEDFSYFMLDSYYLLVCLVGVIFISLCHVIAKLRTSLPTILIIIIVMTQLPFIGGYSVVKGNSQRIIDEVLDSKMGYFNAEGEFDRATVTESNRDSLNKLVTQVNTLYYLTGEYPKYEDIDLETVAHIPTYYHKESDVVKNLSAYGIQLFTDGIDLTNYKKMTYISGYDGTTDYLGDKRFKITKKHDELDVSSIFNLGTPIELPLSDATLKTKRGKTFIIESVYIVEGQGKSSLSGYYLE